MSTSSNLRRGNRTPKHYFRVSLVIYHVEISAPNDNGIYLVIVARIDVLDESFTAFKAFPDTVFLLQAS